MAKNLTSMLDYVAKLPRSGFDMSQSFAFTASTGMILPVYSDFLTSSERVTISTDFFARTQPLVTAAMADVDFYLDWFFVPMTMLFTPWGQIRWQTNDWLSSLAADSFDTNSGQEYFPLVNITDSLDCYNSLLSIGYNSDAWFSAEPSNVPSFDGLFFSSDYFDCRAKSMFRVADCLGYNPLGVLYGDPDLSVLLSKNNPNVFPWRALAYQCIYQNHYRNDDYEVRDIFSYNLDNRLGNMSSPVSFKNSPHNPFTLRYADYRRDYFTSVRPSVLSSAINFLGAPNPRGADTSATEALQSVVNYLSNTDVNTALVGGQFYNQDTGSLSKSDNSTPTQLKINSASSPATGNLRSLFAVEKLIRITGRSAKNYDAQTLAHFGFKVPHDVKHDITFLHSSHGMLHIGEVVGTADTYNGSTGSALGEIAGKGYVSIHDTKKVKFQAPVDGALMCCFRAIPRLRHVRTFDKQNSITSRLDLFIPEFDKLGAQPLYAYELVGGFSTPDGSARIGWQNRYSQYKTKYDRASYVFGNREDFGELQTESVNQYSAWLLVFNRNAFGFTGTSAVSVLDSGASLKCPPTALNSIMVVPYTTTVSSDFAKNVPTAFYTDPFICDFRANVKKVSPMSPTGEPDMISL